MGGMQCREGDVVGDDTSCFFYDCASVDVPINWTIMKSLSVSFAGTAGCCRPLLLWSLAEACVGLCVCCCVLW